MQHSFWRSNLWTFWSVIEERSGFALSFEKTKSPHVVVFTLVLGAYAYTIENLVLPGLKQDFEFCFLRSITSPQFLWLLSFPMKPVLLVFENKYSLGRKLH